MPIARFSLFAAALLIAAPAAAQVNPLAGDTRPAEAPRPAASASGLPLFPADVRGKLVPADGGGVTFIDDQGWYAFLMGGGGTSVLNGTMRQFNFEAAGKASACFAVRIADASLAKFSMAQIQTELESLYTVFDAAVTGDGRVIDKRGSLTLEATGAGGSPPLRALGWDTRDTNGTQVVYSLTPSPGGHLIFACMVPEMPSVAREVIERFLLIGDAMVAVK